MQLTWGIDYHCVNNGAFFKIPLYNLQTENFEEFAIFVTMIIYTQLYF